MEKSLDKKIVV